MKKTVAVGIFCTALLLVGCGQKNPIATDASLEWSGVATTMASSVYMIGLLTDSIPYEGQKIALKATGFAVAADKIITNGHVATALLEAPPSKQWVAIRSGQPINPQNLIHLKAYKYHPDYTGSTYSTDLAVFKVDAVLPSFLPIASIDELDTLSVGQSIATYGFPGETGLFLSKAPVGTFKDGTVSALRSLEYSGTVDNSFFLQHNFGTTGGTSGSPIVNRNGHVVAVNNAGSETAQTIGYGISAALIQPLLAIIDYDTASYPAAPARRLFTEGAAQINTKIDRMTFNNLDFETVKKRWGYNYSISQNSDSLLLVLFSDQQSYRAFVLVEKAAYFGRTYDRCAWITITNIPRQTKTNPFCYSNDPALTVGASKLTLINNYRQPSYKTVQGNLLLYEFCADSMNNSYERGASIVFVENDSLCSAIILYSSTEPATPYRDRIDTTIITRYKSTTGSSLPVYDGLVRFFYHDTTMLAERTYSAGVLNGACREYYENGVLRNSMYFVNGQLDSVFMSYDSAGLLTAVKTFRHDTLNGPCTEYHGIDTLVLEEFYVQGLRDGYSTSYKNRVKASKYHYTRGQLNDTSWIYYADTLIHYKMVYQDGKLNGPWYSYYPGGVLEDSRMYADSVLIDTNRHYLSNGYLQTEKIYSEGQLNYISKTYAGIAINWLMSYYNYDDGVRSGAAATYRAKDTLSATMTYVKNQLQGVYTEYWTNGTAVKSTALYQQGYIVGTKTTYWTDGSTKHFEELYDSNEKGLLIRRITYDQLGNVVSNMPVVL